MCEIFNIYNEIRKVCYNIDGSTYNIQSRQSNILGSLYFYNNEKCYMIEPKKWFQNDEDKLIIVLFDSHVIDEKDITDNALNITFTLHEEKKIILNGKIYAVTLIDREPFINKNYEKIATVIFNLIYSRYLDITYKIGFTRSTIIANAHIEIIFVLAIALIDYKIFKNALYDYNVKIFKEMKLYFNLKDITKEINKDDKEKIINAAYKLAYNIADSYVKNMFENSDNYNTPSIYDYKNVDGIKDLFYN